MKQVIPFSKDIVFKTNIASITSISLEHEEKIIDGEISGDFIIFGDYKIHNDTTEKELFKFKLPFTALIPDNVIPSSIFIDVENFTYETIEDDVLKVNINFIVEGEEQVVEEERKEEPIIEENKEEDNFNDTVVENELNFFLDEKILSNLANIEELREKSNSESLEELNENEEPNESFEEPAISNENTIDKEIIKENQEFRTAVKPVAEAIKEVTEYVEKNKEMPIIEEPKEEPTIRESSPEQLEVSSNYEKVIEEDAKNIENQREEKINEEQKNMTSDQNISSEYVTYHIHIVKTEETLDTIIKNYNSNLDVISNYNDVSSIKVGDKLIIPEYLDE